MQNMRINDQSYLSINAFLSPPQEVYWSSNIDQSSLESMRWGSILPEEDWSFYSQVQLKVMGLTNLIEFNSTESRIERLISLSARFSLIEAIRLVLGPKLDLNRSRASSNTRHMLIWISCFYAYFVVYLNEKFFNKAKQTRKKRAHALFLA
jgi:hypothetical protein